MKRDKRLEQVCRNCSIPAYWKRPINWPRVIECIEISIETTAYCCADLGPDSDKSYLNELQAALQYARSQAGKPERMNHREVATICKHEKRTAALGLQNLNRTQIQCKLAELRN